MKQISSLPLPYHLDYDVSLDWQQDKPKLISRVMNRLERTLQKLREKQEQETLERYRSIVSI